MSQIVRGIRGILESPFIFNFFQNIVGAQNARKRLVEEFIRPFRGARILDIGCGTGEILNFLPEDVKYLGCDISRHYIDHAKRRYKKKRNTNFICSDVRNLSELSKNTDRYNIILAINFLHHLDDHQAKDLFKDIHYLLADEGVVVTSDSVLITGQSRIAQYIIQKDRGQNVRTPEGYINLASDKFEVIEMSILNNLIWIPYSHIILRFAKFNK